MGIPLENLYISWRHDDRVVFEFDGKSGKQISVRKEKTELIKKDDDFHLVLHKVTLADMGTYECYIKQGNKPQNFFKKIILSVSDFPATIPTAFTMTSIPTAFSTTNRTGTLKPEKVGKVLQNGAIIAIVIFMIVILVGGVFLYFYVTK